jgi:hypothetical protein
MAKYNSSGWHFQSTRHSNARRTGHAGGKYAVSYNDPKGKSFSLGVFPTDKEAYKAKLKYVKTHEGFSEDDDFWKTETNSKKDFGYASTGFQTFPLKDGYEIVAHFENTRNGFRHIAVLMKNGREVDRAKATYLNRTWERYEYETVIRDLLDKSGVLSEPDKKAFLVKGELQAEKESDAMFRSVATACQIGEIIGKDQKEKNDWKKRMLKAGLPELDIPEDWEQLSENEKETRLNAVINHMKNTKHYGHLSFKPVPENVDWVGKYAVLTKYPKKEKVGKIGKWFGMDKDQFKLDYDSNNKHDSRAVFDDKKKALNYLHLNQSEDNTLFIVKLGTTGQEVD